jgi:TonB family protein
MVEEEAAEALTPKAASNRGRSVMVAALAVVAMGLCTVLFVYPGVLRTGVHIASSAGQDTPPLSLRVERTGADILLTWNRDSTAIQRAAHAVLTISDGERHDNYDMDLGQLRNGSIVYSPLTTDVSFRMEVAGQGNAKPVSESVRVLRTRPSPMPDGSETAIETARNNAKPVAPPNASNSSDADDSSVQPVPAPARTVVPSKPFNTESLADRLHPAAPVAVALPEAPALNSGPAAPSTLPSIGAAPVAPAPFIPAPAPAAPAKQAPASPATAGGRIVQAQLIFSKQPEYPKLARQMGIKGSVEVLATIGADGHVKHVKVEKGHPLLAKAASDAVMQWVYRPTLLNGAAVQNETHITLNFTGDK